jgi:hypothetical protein
MKDGNATSASLLVNHEVTRASVTEGAEVGRGKQTASSLSSKFPLPCPQCGAPMRRLSKLCLDCRRVEQRERDSARHRAQHPEARLTCMWCRFSKRGPCSRHGGLPTAAKKELARQAYRRRKAQVTA